MHLVARIAAVAVAMCCATSLVDVAYAQPAKDPPGEASGDGGSARERAKQLFIEGRKLAGEGRIDEACARFAASRALADALGVVLNLADCREQLGSLAEALSLWREAEQRLDEGDPRFGKAVERRNALERRVPRVAVRIPQQAPATTVVRIDGEAVPASDWGRKLAVDPGEHRIEIVWRDDVKPHVEQVDLAEGEAVEVAPVLPEEVRPVEVEEGFGPLAITGAVLLGLGGAGIVSWAITGGLYLQAESEVADGCDEERRCSPEALDAVDRGKALGVANTVSLAAGLGVGAVGALLLIIDGTGLADDERVADIQVAPYGAGLQVLGRF